LLKKEEKRINQDIRRQEPKLVVQVIMLIRFYGKNKSDFE